MILNILYDQTCSAKTQHGVHLWFNLYVNKTVNIIYKDFQILPLFKSSCTTIYITCKIINIVNQIYCRLFDLLKFVVIRP
jgi:hypothetical protein